MALIENIQRENLNPIEEALAYRRLADEFQLTQEDIATAVGKDRASVANYLRLLKPSRRSARRSGRRPAVDGPCAGAARARSEAEQRRLAREIIARSLSVRETESMVKKMPASATASEEPPAPKPIDVHTRAAEDRLRLAARHAGPHRAPRRRGRIEIDFGSEDELIRIYEQLTDRG